MILICFISILVGFLVAKSYFKGKIVLCFILASLAVGLASFYAIDQQAYLYETLTLTALNEKSEESNGREVFLREISNENKPVKPQVLEGKWFYTANSLCWRPKEDIRQPEGITKEIKFKIPVGEKRKVQFVYNGWQGKVEVSINNSVNIIDTSKQTVVDLSASSSKLLMQNMIIKIALWAFVYSGVFFMIFILCNYFKRKTQHFKAWFGRHNDKFIYGMLALFTGLVMFRYASQPAFWSDEMIQLGIVYNDKSSILDAIKNVLDCCIKGNDMSPPLYGIIAAFWLRIMPFGQNWLYLLNIIFVGIGIYLIGITASKVASKSAGIVSCVIAAGSSSMLIATCYEFRAYALLFFSCALLLYTYVNRIEHMGEEKLSEIVKMGLAISLVIFSHYYGAILCFALFMFDFVCFIKKKIRFNCIISYLIAGVLFLPWIIVVLMNAIQVLSVQTWQMKPDFITVVNLYIQYLGDNKYFALLILCCFVVVIAPAGNQKSATVKIAMIIIITVPVLIMAFYGNFINPQGTGFMYRYFIGLFPSVFLILGVGVAQIIDYMKKQLTIQKSKIKKSMMVTLVGGVLMTVLLPTYNIVALDKAGGGMVQPFYELAEYLLNQNDAYSPQVTAVWLHSAQFDGMKYFITHKGAIDSPQIIMWNDFIQESDRYSKIHLSTMHIGLPNDVQIELEKEFIMTGYNAYLGLYTYERKNG